MEYILSPSILAADFARLGEEIKKVDEAGAKYLHIDVMDGVFVPSISIGMPVIKAIRSVTNKFFDVHLMIQEPERYIDDFIACGADGITIHAEACKSFVETVDYIKGKGLKAGVSVSPNTPVEALIPVIDKADMFLIMTVEPGFGGQSYLDSCTLKIRKLHEILSERKIQKDIQVDGGITRDNFSMVLEAGANVIVMGSSIFKGNIEENVKYFQKELLFFQKEQANK